VRASVAWWRYGEAEMENVATLLRFRAPNGGI